MLSAYENLKIQSVAAHFVWNPKFIIICVLQDVYDNLKFKELVFKLWIICKNIQIKSEHSA